MNHFITVFLPAVSKLVCLLLVPIICIVILVQIYRGFNSAKSLYWSKTNAILIKYDVMVYEDSYSRAGSPGVYRNKTHKLDVRYGFTVDGSEYTGNYIGANDIKTFNWFHLEEYRSLFKVGDSISVIYNPSDPNDNFMYEKGIGGSLMMEIVKLLIALFSGIFCVWFVFYRKK
jgi:hypothetical protein